MEGLRNMPRWQVMVSGFATRFQKLGEFLQSVVLGEKNREPWTYKIRNSLGGKITGRSN